MGPMCAHGTRRHGAGRWLLLVSPRVAPGPGMRRRHVPAHSSVAALGQAQDGPGLCPTSLVPGLLGRVDKGLLFETCSGALFVCGLLHL